MWFYVSFCFEAALLPAFVLSGVEFGYLAPGMKGKRSWSELLLWQKRRRCVATVLPRRKAPNTDSSQSLRHRHGQEWSLPLMGWEQDISISGQALAVWEGWRREVEDPNVALQGELQRVPLGAVRIKLWSHWKITVMKSFNKLVAHHACYIAE